MRKCNYCGSIEYIMQKNIITQKSIYTLKEEEYKEICYNCGNLLFGYIKPIKKIKKEV